MEEIKDKVIDEAAAMQQHTGRGETAGEMQQHSRDEAGDAGVREEKRATVRLSKTYKSGTGVSFNVRKKGARRVTHVVFDLLTIGGSTFVTDDPLLQEAVEGHRFFKDGSVWIDSSEGEASVAAMRAEAETRPAENVDGDDEVAAAMPSQHTGLGEEATGIKAVEVVEFASVVEGKDYLADRYGVSRTQLRTRAAIEALAAEKGLKVAWK